ncbi:hypothetical protein [Proteus penneri]|uniref:hypothetical protein n=1 Tax=Proteus penneri TaxID=102862 RepID=UPI0034D49BE1
MKRNIDDFDGMKDFIISIITVVAWVLIGAIIAIGYFTIETKGESIILSFISTIFTIISSLGIAATIGVYFWQRNDAKKMEIEKTKKYTKTYLSVFIEHYESLKVVIEQLQKLENITKNNSLLVFYTGGYNIHCFHVKNKNNIIIENIPFYKLDIPSLSTVYSNSTTLNPTIAEKYFNIYVSSRHIDNVIENLKIKIENLGYIDSREAHKILITVKYKEILDKINSDLKNFHHYYDEL